MKSIAMKIRTIWGIGQSGFANDPAISVTIPNKNRIPPNRCLPEWSPAKLTQNAMTMRITMPAAISPALLRTMPRTQKKWGVKRVAHHTAINIFTFIF